jgi:hypothetical protein
LRASRRPFSACAMQDFAGSPLGLFSDAVQVFPQ